MYCEWKKLRSSRELVLCVVAHELMAFMMGVPVVSEAGCVLVVWFLRDTSMSKRVCSPLYCVRCISEDDVELFHFSGNITRAMPEEALANSHMRAPVFRAFPAEDNAGGSNRKIRSQTMMRRTVKIPTVNNILVGCGRLVGECAAPTFRSFPRRREASLRREMRRI